jgi:prepilin-type N-terminal cleavage/methylation domain-containing protein
MKRLKKGQRGFTLIEVLIVIGLTGLISVGLTTTVMQVLTMSHNTANHMTAVRQVQQAGFWVSPDVQMTQSVNASGSLGFPLTLTWTEFGETSNYAHEVIYTLEPMPSGDYDILWREHYIGPDFDSLSLDSTYKVAEYINPAQTRFFAVAGGGAYKFQVTATVGDQSETKTYEVKPRPET